MGFVKWMDGLGLIGKLIFCIPALNIIWAIYRIVKGASNGNILLLIIGILWIVPGAAFLWFVDLVGILIKGRPFLAN